MTDELWTPEQEAALALQWVQMRAALDVVGVAFARIQTLLEEISRTSRELPNLPTDCEHSTKGGNWHEGFQCQDCGTMLDRDGNPLEPVGDCARCGNPENVLRWGICQSCSGDLLEADRHAVPSEGV